MIVRRPSFYDDDVPTDGPDACEGAGGRHLAQTSIFHGRLWETETDRRRPAHRASLMLTTCWG